MQAYWDTLRYHGIIRVYIWEHFMWHDIEATEDFLNFEVVARAAANIVLQAGEEPISIGVSGCWGIGKTSLVNMIRNEIQASGSPQYRFINFNAWLYQGYDDARMSLLQIVSDTLIQEAQVKKKGIEKAWAFLKRIKLLRLFSAAAPATTGFLFGHATTGSLWGGMTGAIAAGIANTSSNNISESAKAIVNAGSDIVDHAKDMVQPEENISLPQEISKLRMEFQQLLQELDIKLVVIVDDLDRCLPDTAISTLEAMRLLLFMKNTAFIIAADQQMTRKAVRAHFNGSILDDDLVTNYFDKLIQIPIMVPLLGISEIKAYILMLLAEDCCHRNKITKDTFSHARGQLSLKLKSSWRGTLTHKDLEDAMGDAAPKMAMEIDLADQLADIMATAEEIKGNPRLIKRFLNDLKIKEAIATAQGMTFDFTLLTKVQLFIRCAPPPAVDFLQQRVIESINGQPDFIKELEARLSKGETYAPSNDSWKSPFIERWLCLKPLLSNIDLRPLLLLRKDAISTRVAYDSLSENAQALLEELTKINRWDENISSRISGIGIIESDGILTRYIRHSAQNQWDGNNVRAILEIAHLYPALREKALRTLDSIPGKTISPGIVVMVQKFEWTKEILTSWSGNQEVQAPAKNAIAKKK